MLLGLWTFVWEVLYVGDVITWAIGIAVGVWSPRGGGKILLPDAVNVYFLFVKSFLNFYIVSLHFQQDDILNPSVPTQGEKSSLLCICFQLFNMEQGSSKLQFFF